MPPVGIGRAGCPLCSQEAISAAAVGPTSPESATIVMQSVRFAFATPVRLPLQANRQSCSSCAFSSLVRMADCSTSRWQLAVPSCARVGPRGWRCLRGGRVVEVCLVEVCVVDVRVVDVRVVDVRFVVVVVGVVVVCGTVSVAVVGVVVVVGAVSVAVVGTDAAGVDEDVDVPVWCEAPPHPARMSAVTSATAAVRTNSCMSLESRAAGHAAGRA
ncbi:MAG: hypothetical protein ACRDLP_02580 [Solirubrobacteraceae bacterium]